MKLSDYRTKYFSDRHDLSEATLTLHRTTFDYLERDLGRGAILGKVTRADAADFAAFMATQPMQLSTQRAHLGRAKQIFQRAADRDIIPQNPFDRIKTTAPKVDVEWRYVSAEETERMLDAARDWRIVIAIARYAGLRANEIKRLQWADVDLQRGAISVTNPGRVNTTKKKARTVPIQPAMSVEFSQQLARINHVLGDPWPSGEVCAVGWGDYLRKIERIRKRANVERYGKPLHSMRKSLETDWLAQFPLPAVANFLGHDPSVALKHYFKVSDSTFDLVRQGDTKIL